MWSTPTRSLGPPPSRAVLSGHAGSPDPSAGPGPLYPYGPPAAPQSPHGSPPVRGASTLLLPLLALVALVLTGVSVFLPWRAGQPVSALGIASSGVGVGVLVSACLFAIPVFVDLFTARVRFLGLVAVPGVILGAAAATIAAGVGLSSTWRPPSLGPGGPGAATFLVAVVGLVIIGVVAVVGFVRHGEGRGPASSSRRGPALAALAGAAVIVVGATVVFAGAFPAESSPALTAAPAVAPEAFTGSTGTTSGPPAHVDPVTATFDDAMPSTPCPDEAAATMPEPTGAVVVAHDATVHVALCRSAAGRLYYYGANDRNGQTITLPARRSEDSWYAKNGNVTYFVTEDSLEILRPPQPQIDTTLEGGW